MKQVHYLCGADADWLLENDPGDTLQQGRCGQRALISPVIQRTREKCFWVKIRKGSLLSLMISQKEGVKK